MLDFVLNFGKKQFFSFWFFLLFYASQLPHLNLFPIFLRSIKPRSAGVINNRKRIVCSAGVVRLLSLYVFAAKENIHQVSINLHASHCSGLISPDEIRFRPPHFSHFCWQMQLDWKRPHWNNIELPWLPWWKIYIITCVNPANLRVPTLRFWTPLHIFLPRETLDQKLENCWKTFPILMKCRRFLLSTGNFLAARRVDYKKSWNFVSQSEMSVT